MDKMLLSIAPVEAIEHDIDSNKLVEDVLQCAELGAAMVHLHVRDKRACLTDDMEFTQEIIYKIKKYSDIIIQVSTGGISELSIQQRCVPILFGESKIHSLNVGSVNLGKNVYINLPKDIDYTVNLMKQYNKKAEVEVFELGMIYTTKLLQKAHNIPFPMLFSIVLGHHGAAPANENVLKYMVQNIYDYFSPEEVLWGITQAHRKDFTLISKAIDMGAFSVRLGFEDSHFGNNKIVEYNWQIIKDFLEFRDDVILFTPNEVTTILNL